MWAYNHVRSLARAPHTHTYTLYHLPHWQECEGREALVSRVLLLVRSYVACARHSVLHLFSQNFRQFPKDLRAKIHAYYKKRYSRRCQCRPPYSPCQCQYRPYWRIPLFCFLRRSHRLAGTRNTSCSTRAPYYQTCHSLCSAL